MAVPTPYLADPVHAGLQQHYYRGSEGAALLMFTPAWAEANLPRWDPRASPLTVVLKDTEDGGKLYPTRLCCAFEQWSLSGHDRDWNEVVLTSLQDYFYFQHHCQCHRKAAAESAGADTDDVCDGERFVIDRIEAPGLPGLVLYSETLTAEELERALTEKAPQATAEPMPEPPGQPTVELETPAEVERRIIFGDPDAGRPGGVMNY